MPTNPQESLSLNELQKRKFVKFKAKPIAVPTNGAVQGVAKKVKNIPVVKSPKNPSPLYDSNVKIFGGKKN